MNPADFLTALWGTTPRGLIQTWDATTRTTAYLHDPTEVGGSAGRPNVYTGVATAPPGMSPSRRAGNDQVVAIAGMWLDIDINGGPDNRTGRAPNWDAALHIASALADPTIIVNSGWGMQAWWLLEQPWDITRGQDRHAAGLLARQWQRGHAEAVKGRGWGIDAANDLARILRLPGTINTKSHAEPRTVTVEHHDLSLRYSRRELHDLVGHIDGSDYATRGVAAHPGARPVQITAPTGTLSDDARALLDMALELDPQVRATWWRECRPPGDGSGSAWDLSLATRLAAVDPEVAPQVLAEIVSAFRGRAPDGDPKGKARRVDYLQRTVAIAVKQGAHDALAAAAAAAAADSRLAALRRAGLA